MDVLKAFKDDKNNEVIFSGELSTGIDVRFHGGNNKLFLSDDCRVSELILNFDCDNAVCKIGRTSGKFNIRMGQDANVSIGNGVSTTSRVFISAAEGASVSLGDDCMLSVGVTIRSDDSHPIFDVHSGKRINISKNVAIGKHVWIGQEAAILGKVRTSS